MGTLNEAREMFAKDRFATVATGAVIDEIGEDHAKCSLTLTEDHRNAYGNVMGGAIYTLADFAFAVASNFDKDVATVSVVGQASFMAATKGNKLFATADLIKDGRRNCFYSVTVTDDLSKTIAVVTFNGTHIAKEKEA
ncbi:MAG: PaaI family thioesterase [Lachnospiraceae bacterium]|nr:PaaI family thioesterase [Lachnospiraceae bacterium]